MPEYTAATICNEIWQKQHLNCTCIMFTKQKKISLQFRNEFRKAPLIS